MISKARLSQIKLKETNPEKYYEQKRRRENKYKTTSEKYKKNRRIYMREYRLRMKKLSTVDSD